MKTLLTVLTLVLSLMGAGPAAAQQAKTAKATFAGGCFWCVEEVFEKIPGVVSAVSGYIGGTANNPTYHQVSSGSTGHTEAVEVLYDPAKVSYEKLLEAFWINHDPTVLDRQFCDAGSQYRPAIFVHDPEQRRLALESKARAEKSKRFPQPILTPVQDATRFWPAEDYHQDYYKKEPTRYKWYVTGCGRYRRLEQLWGPRSG